jgi:hypothetical protein
MLRALAGCDWDTQCLLPEHTRSAAGGQLCVPTGRYSGLARCTGVPPAPPPSLAPAVARTLSRYYR